MKKKKVEREKKLHTVMNDKKAENVNVASGITMRRGGRGAECLVSIRTEKRLVRKMKLDEVDDDCFHKNN